MLLYDNRIRVIVGHSGSGKTEFALNYAFQLRKLTDAKISIADLDVVNPYFRSRECTDEMAKYDIRIIGSSIKAEGVDTPAISAEVNTPLEDEKYHAILDVGGDKTGTRAIGRYVKYFTEGAYDMFFVVNANRERTTSAKEALFFLREIEGASRIKVTGIVNTTHMLKSTTVKDIYKGEKVALELSEMTGLPIKYTACLAHVAEQLDPEKVSGKIFPMKLFVREVWMS